MYIKNLSLQNFRNFPKLDLDFKSGVNVILAPNGSGKTNIIEAISYLSVPKSFRKVLDKNLIRKDILVQEIDVADLSTDVLKELSSFTRCVGEISDSDSETGTGTGTDTPPSAGRATPFGGQAETDTLEFFIQYNGSTNKSLKIGGKKVRISNFVGRLQSVIFSPEVIDVVNSSPSKRRHFLDRLIATFESEYLDNLSNYNKVLRNRNKILSDIDIYDKELLDYWDDLLIKYGSQILFSRNNFFEEINNRIGMVGKDILKQNYDLGIDYLSLCTQELEISQAEQIELLFNEQLQKSQRRDVKRGSTSIGPHRDDFNVLLNSYELSNFASRGQQRIGILSLLFSYVLFLEENLKKPVLLLDDVFSELDASHRKLLLDFIQSKDFQVIITATELDEDLDENKVNVISL